MDLKQFKVWKEQRKKDLLIELVKLKSNYASRGLFLSVERQKAEKNLRQKYETESKLKILEVNKSFMRGIFSNPWTITVGSGLVVAIIPFLLGIKGGTSINQSHDGAGDNIVGNKYIIGGDTSLDLSRARLHYNISFSGNNKIPELSLENIGGSDAFGVSVRLHVASRQFKENSSIDYYFERISKEETKPVPVKNFYESVKTYEGIFVSRDTKPYVLAWTQYKDLNGNKHGTIFYHNPRILYGYAYYAGTYDETKNLYDAWGKQIDEELNGNFSGSEAIFSSDYTIKYDWTLNN